MADLDESAVEYVKRKFAAQWDDELAAAEARGRQRGQQWAIDALRVEGELLADAAAIGLKTMSDGFLDAADHLEQLRADSITKEGRDG